MRIFFLILVAFSLSACCVYKSSNDSENLHISKKKLDKSINCLLDLDSNDIKISNAIEIVRIDNTIGYYHLEGKIYESFGEKIEEVFYNQIVKLLKFARYKGGTMYSKEFDIFWGIPYNENSRYDLIDISSPSPLDL